MDVTTKSVYAALLLFSIFFVVISLSAVSQKGLTNDEIVHITAGYSYWKTFDFRLNTEHPPLIKLIASVPLLVLSPFFDMANSAWKNNKEWELASNFFFVQNQNADQILWWSRIPMVFVALLGLLYIFWWSQELYGNKAAVFAAFLFAVSPSMLAHAPLVTTDIGLMVFVLMTCYYVRRFCEHKYKQWLYAAGISAGLALASKFSSLYLIPTLIGLAAAYEYSVRENKKFWTLVSFWKLCVWIGVILAIGLVVVVLVYGVGGSPMFITGLFRVLLHGELGHRAFLLGEHSENGWWWYFIIAFLVKEPIALLILLSIGVYSVYVQRNRLQLVDELFLLIPAIIFILAFSVGKIDIGIRHIFPAYPFLMIWVSKVVNLNWNTILKKGFFSILILWYVYAAFASYPNYLAYFNEFVGPENGYNVLMDSNLDWGQDLKSLSKYLHEQGNPIVKLAYFGTDNKDYRNITHEELKCGPQTGLLAISVNMLNGFTDLDAGCSRWLKSHDPIAKIGYSIFVYNITDSDIVNDREIYCKDKCRDNCKQKNLIFAKSSFNKTCRCRCA